jgi:hypothetical protein
MDDAGLKPSGRTTTVTVDGTLPTQNGRTIYAHPDAKGELWPAIFEKAYAKLWKGYGAISNGGDPGTALLMLTGAAVDRLNCVASSADALFGQLQAALGKNQPLVSSTRGAGKVPSSELHENHAYTLMNCTVENGQKFVTVRNPWGHEGATGPGAADGIHKLPLAAFVQNFEYVDTARV